MYKFHILINLWIYARYTVTSINDEYFCTNSLVIFYLNYIFGFQIHFPNPMYISLSRMESSRLILRTWFLELISAKGIFSFCLIWWDSMLWVSAKPDLRIWFASRNQIRTHTRKHEFLHPLYDNFVLHNIRLKMAMWEL